MVGAVLFQVVDFHFQVGPFAVMRHQAFLEGLQLVFQTVEVLQQALLVLHLGQGFFVAFHLLSVKGPLGGQFLNQLVSFNLLEEVQFILGMGVLEDLANHGLTLGDGIFLSLHLLSCFV